MYLNNPRWLDLEYADCITCRGETPQNQIRGTLDMTLNCIWWWGYRSGDLEGIDYSFIAVTFRFHLWAK